MTGNIYNTIRPTYYADTINGSGVALSGLVDPIGAPVAVGAGCYVANGDGSGNPVVWTVEVSSAAVDHSTVEAVSGAVGCRWLKSGAFGGGGGSALTPAQAAYINGWFQNQQAFLTGLNPALTEFTGLKLGVTENGVAGNGVDGNVEGGGIKSATGAVTQLAPTIYQLPKTNGFAIVYRGKFLAPSGSVQQCGIGNASAHGIAFAAATSLSATNWALRINGSAETDVTLSVADTTFHDFGIVHLPGTAAVNAYVDGTLVGGTSTLTNLVDEPMWPQIFNAGATGFITTKAMWGYVAP